MSGSRSNPAAGQLRDQSDRKRDSGMPNIPHWGKISAVEDTISLMVAVRDGNPER